MYEDSVREEYSRVTPLPLPRRFAKNGAKLQKKSELRKYSDTKSANFTNFFLIICINAKKAVTL